MFSPREFPRHARDGELERRDAQFLAEGAIKRLAARRVTRGIIWKGGHVMGLLLGLEEISRSLRMRELKDCYA